MPGRGTANTNGAPLTTAAPDRDRRRELVVQLERTRGGCAWVMVLGALGALDRGERRERIRKLVRTRNAGTCVMVVAVLACVILIWSGKAELVPFAVCVLVAAGATVIHTDRKAKSLKTLNRQDAKTKQPGGTAGEDIAA